MLLISESTIVKLQEDLNARIGAVAEQEKINENLQVRNINKHKSLYILHNFLFQKMFKNLADSKITF